MPLCLNCKIETFNPKFCSRSCSTSYNNKKYPKRKVTGKCKQCKASIRSGWVFCKECYISLKVIDGNTTIAQLKAKYTTSNFHSVIRKHARRQQKLMNCQKCDYNIFVEVCHIKAVSTFDDSSKLSEVNAIENLICLCPNCHLELDNGLFVIEINDNGGNSVQF